MVTKGSWIGPLKSSAGCCLVALALIPQTVLSQGSPNILWQRATNSDRINTVIFSRDGSTLYSGSSDRLINIWNANNGAPLGVLDTGAPEVHPSSIEALALSPDGSKLVSVNYQQIKIWQLPGGALQTINGHSDWVVDCAYHPNGTMFATASFDTTVKVWNNSGGLLKTFTTSSQQRAVAFSPDGTYLASAGGDDVVTVHRVSDWATVAVFKGHTDSIYTLAWSPNGAYIASGGYDQVLRVWNVANGTQRFAVGGNHGNIYGLAFSPDGSTVAYTDGEGNTIKLVRVSDGAVIATYTSNVDNVQCMAYSPQGTLAYGRVDRTVVVANVSGQSGGAPSISLTSPANGATYTAPANVMLSASASSPAGVTKVKFYVNGALVATDTTAPYAAAVALNAGTYNIQASVVAQDGQTAATGVRTITVGSSSPQTSHIFVQVSGAGSVSPNYNGQVVNNGTGVAMTAVPAANWVFTGWSGTVNSSSRTISFVVQKDTTVQANFSPSPFARVTGQYFGLVQSDPIDIDHAGNFRLAVASTGVFSGAFHLGNQLYSVSGQFQMDGSYSGTAQGGGSSVNVSLQLPMNDNSDQLSGTISDDTTSCNVSADRFVWNPLTRPAPAGTYSVIIPGGSDAGEPYGAGIGFVTVNSAGAVTFNGTLSDMTTVASVTYLSKNRSWPLFTRGAGGITEIIGQVQIENIPGQSDMDGNLAWMRRPSGGRFSGGFGLNTSFLASKIVSPPPPGINSLFIQPSSHNTSVTIGGADTGGDTIFDATLTAGNQLFPDSFGSQFGLQFNFQPNGLVSGQFLHPITGDVIGFLGIVFQKQHMASGFWLRGPEMCGYITVQQGSQGDSGGFSNRTTQQSPPPTDTSTQTTTPLPTDGHKHGKH